MACHSAPVAEEGHIESEEPPEYRVISLPEPPRPSIYRKSAPHASRRTSLLTQQLHTNSSDQHSESDAASPTSHPLVRGLSASSGRSVPSTYELVSDNDMSSAGIRTASPSPPPQGVHPPQGLGIIRKGHLAAEPLIVGQDTVSTPDSEKLVEADLGRRRCITFACGGGSGQRSPIKPETPQSDVAGDKSDAAKEEPPVKRKCALTFSCPSRESAEDSDIFATLSRKSTLERVPQVNKAVEHSSIAPIIEQAGSGSVGDEAVSEEAMPRIHRDSDATVRGGSPAAFKKPMFVKRRTYSVDLHNEEPESPGAFHEFGGPSADDAWTTELDLNRPALTTRDCLYKENLIRKLGDEADQEALEDEEVYGDENAVAGNEHNDEQEADEEEDENDEDEEDDEDPDEDEDEDLEDQIGSRAVSETGFDSDDEGGLQDDDDNTDDGSDYEWWTPGSKGNSKPVNLSFRPSRLRALSNSSLETDEDEPTVDVGSFLRGRTQSASKPIPAAEALPDSTDFVCGTLDEDHPLEQVYMSQLARRRAQKQQKDAIKVLREGEESQRDQTSSPRVSYMTSQHGSLSSRAARSGTSRHVSREPSPYPTRNHKSSSGAVSREPSPYPTRSLKSLGPMAGRTKHNRSPAPNCLRFRDAVSQRLRSPAPVRNHWAPTAQSPDEGRRLSDPGTPAQPMFIHGSQNPTRRPKSQKTFSLPKGSTAIPIDRQRCLRFADDSAPFLKTSSRKHSLA